MTDRVHSLVVVLEKDVRVDDVEALTAAIAQLRGVLSVEPIVADHAAHMAESRALEHWRTKIHDLLWPKRSP